MVSFARNLWSRVPPLGAIVVLVLLAALIGVTVRSAAQIRPMPRLVSLDNTTDILFGLDRSPLTRTSVISVCGFVGVGENCADKAATDPSSVAGTVPAGRPAVRSAEFVSDLDGVTCQRIAEGGKGTATDMRPSTLGQFPAAQVTVAAELVGQTGLKLTFVANPRGAETIAPGTYCGYLDVDREGSATIPHGVRIVLGDRDNPVPLATAVWFLVLGSVLGVAVRLGNDQIAALIPVRRRQRSMERRVAAWSRDDHKEELRDGLEDVADAIATFDVTDAAARLDKLEQILDAPPGSPVAQVAADQLSIRRRIEAESLPGSLTVPWFVDRYWIFSTALIVVVVTLSGLKTQYLDAVDVSDDLSSWLALGIYGLAFQITVSTVAEAVGKLTPGSKQGAGS